MSIKLVVDNGEAVAVGPLGLSDQIRGLADRLDGGEYLGAFRVVVVIETDDTLSREILGEQMSGFEIIGMMEVVKADTISDPLR